MAEATPGPWFVTGKRATNVEGPRPEVATENPRLIAAAPAYKRAWEMVPSALQARILRLLQETGEGWVQDSIVAAGREAP